MPCVDLLLEIGADERVPLRGCLGQGLDHHRPVQRRAATRIGQEDLGQGIRSASSQSGDELEQAALGFVVPRRRQRPDQTEMDGLKLDPVATPVRSSRFFSVQDLHDGRLPFGGAEPVERILPVGRWRCIPGRNGGFEPGAVESGGLPVTVDLGMIGVVGRAGRTRGEPGHATNPHAVSGVVSQPKHALMGLAEGSFLPVLEGEGAGRRIGVQLAYEIGNADGRIRIEMAAHLIPDGTEGGHEGVEIEREQEILDGARRLSSGADQIVETRHGLGRRKRR